MLSKTQIKYIQSLRHKKYRQKFSQFIAEGEKIASDLLAADQVQIQSIYALGSWIREHATQLRERPECAVEEVTEAELSRISSLTTPHTVLLVAGIPDLPVEADPRGGISLVLEDIRDPGNLGTLIRTADWFGIRKIFCSPGCADPFSPKTVQASMGSIARVQIREISPESLLADYRGLPSYAAVLDGSDVAGFGKVREAMILIGNESRGLSPALAGACSYRITIPRQGHAQSLNAAVAAGIICSRLCL